MNPLVSVYLGLSLDQCIARPDGRLDFLERFQDEAIGDYGYGAFMADVDTLLLGRTTFETVLGFEPWPFAGKRVAVMSHRPLPASPAVSRFEGSLASALTHLHAAGARHVYLDGGELVRQGLRERVVDSLTLTVMPVLVGAGRRLFGDAVLPEQALRLTRSQVFPNGVVQLRYER